MYRQLDDEKYTRLRKELLRDKGSNLQREFIEAARSDDQFVGFIRKDNDVGTEGEKEVLILDERLTEHEYKEPPKDTEQGMYEAWKDVPPETACRVTFWGEVTLRHIEHRCIKGSYLAANGGSLSGGLERIDKVLLGNGKKEIDSCVRTILRRMSGLPEARGNISVYVNCPFGRAWWRMRWTKEVCEATGAAHSGIIKLLHHNKQEYWETLVRLVISKNSTLGDHKVRNVLIQSLAEIPESDKRVSILKSKNLKSVCRLLSVRCAWQELGILEVDELKTLIGEEINSISD